MAKPPRSSRSARNRRVQLKPNDPGTRAVARARKLDEAHLRRLAEFRFQLRRFLHVSQAAAERMGVHHQQYQMLQCVGGMPEGILPAIANVAERMLLKHNSTVELVDRAIDEGLLRRIGDEADHRRILLRVTPHGERILAALAEIHTGELEQSGPELVRALDDILRPSNRRAARFDRLTPRRKAATR